MSGPQNEQNGILTDAAHHADIVHVVMFGRALAPTGNPLGMLLLRSPKVCSLAAAASCWSSYWSS